MGIRKRLTYLFTLLTAVVVGLFACLIYLSAKQTREQEFYALLRQEALTKANAVLQANIDQSTLHQIYQNNRQTLQEVEVAIYQGDDQLIYHDAVERDFVQETQDMLLAIRKNQHLQFVQDQAQVIGMLYHHASKDYVVTAAAYDQYGYAKLTRLRNALIFGFVLGILLIYLTGRLFARRAFIPIQRMSAEAKEISAQQLKRRLPIPQSKYRSDKLQSNDPDEVSVLAHTFNDLLDRLEQSFEAQKHFVSNISHELRTPLTALIAELDLSESKSLSPEDYQRVLKNTRQDARRIQRLSSSLLDLAKASYDPTEIGFQTLRVDELLLDALQSIQQSNPLYQVSLDIASDFDDLESQALEQVLAISGNEYLLKVAFVNLIENGCKFSDNHACLVEIKLVDQQICVEFTDRGIGISSHDIDQLFEPFFRGQNQVYTPGNGIGLSLAKRIFVLHRARIDLESTVGIGTKFRVLFP